MRYLLRTNAGYEHLAKKFKRAVLKHVGRDGSETAVCRRRFLFVSTVQRGGMTITSLPTCSVMWALVCYPLGF